MLLYAENAHHAFGNNNVPQFNNLCAQLSSTSHGHPEANSDSIMVEFLYKLTNAKLMGTYYLCTMKRPKVVLVPFPAQGHVSPMLQLASALSRLGFQPIIINPLFIHTQLSCTDITNEEDEDGGGVVFMPIPDGLDDDQSRDFFTISHAMENVMPLHLEQLLQSFGYGGIAYMIVDLLASWAIHVADRCQIPVAGFWPAMYATYSIVNAIPQFIEGGLISEIDGSPLVEETISFLPSLPKLNSAHLPWLVGNKAARLFRFKFWLATLQRSSTLDWVLVNSFPEENQGQEQPQICPMNPMLSAPPQIFHVGPLTRYIEHSPSMWEEDDSCISWLDKQCPSSVVYVSFGSWVSLSDQHHVTELAMALEDSGRPFLWVLRTAQQVILPIHFLERVGCRGKVVDWAPQREVLESEAVGCFLTHCGWNSTMEAIIAGKPLVCWPLSGDQFVNCEFIAHVWEVGIKLEGKAREDIKKCITMKASEWQDLKKNMLALKKKVTGIGSEVTTMRKLISFTQAVMNRKTCTEEGYKL